MRADAVAGGYVCMHARASIRISAYMLYACVYHREKDYEQHHLESRSKMPSSPGYFWLCANPHLGERCPATRLFILWAEISVCRFELGMG